MLAALLLLIGQSDNYILRLKAKVLRLAFQNYIFTNLLTYSITNT